MRLYHGTHHENLPIHAGLSLTPDFAAAREYARVRGGEWIHEVSVDLANLVVEEVEVDLRKCRDSDCWPGDSKRQVAELAARGVDVIVFDDCCHAAAHRTYRIISDRALAALVYEGGYDP